MIIFVFSRGFSIINKGSGNILGTFSFSDPSLRSGDMEAGIIELSLFEELPNGSTFPNESISTVYYESKQCQVVNRYDFMCVH